VLQLVDISTLALNGVSKDVNISIDEAEIDMVGMVD